MKKPISDGPEQTMKVVKVISVIMFVVGLVIMIIDTALKLP